MTEHLRHEEIVDALDDALEPSRRAHLADCAGCRAEVESRKAVLQEAKGVDAPVPSPLFWDHFSERVRQATAAEPLPAASAWWHAWWRPVGVLAGALGAVALVVALRPATTRPADPAAEREQGASAVPMSDDGSWSLVIGLASELDVADVREAAKPAEGTADAMIEELTAAQRSALVRLLQKEVGEQ